MTDTACGDSCCSSCSTAHPTQEQIEQSRGGVIGFAEYVLHDPHMRPALVGGALILLGMIGGLLGSLEIITSAVFTIATVIALYPMARDGIMTLLTVRAMNMNLLMTTAAVGALLLGETLEAATLVFLSSIGEALEGYSGSRARHSLRSLLSIAPARAIRLHEGREEEVAVEALAVGDVILVKPGERIPMDGAVTAGTSGVNQAPITGESIPVHKARGAEVFAGTINGDGALEIRVTRLAADNTLNRIIKLVEEAQSVRAPSQRLIDRFAQRYTPIVAVAAVAVATVPPVFFGAPFWNTPTTQGWLYRALELLVIACPCSLVISTPVTVISAITAAARRGVLIKGGAHLEALGRLRAFAFDKTGTLTRGQPVVTLNHSVDCITAAPCAFCDDMLALAAAVERRSAHPLAQAVVTAAQVRGVDSVYAPADSVETLAGRGVRGMVNGRLVTVGSHGYFDAEVPHDGDLCAEVRAVEAGGQTAMLLSDGERVRGYLAVADEARADSQQVIADLRALGVTTVMLTGDNATVADAIARAVGVDDVRAGLLPADKVEAVKRLTAQFGSVAMVGDGINDTPALAAAAVGVAMGGAGSAQALETADVALLADDLTQLPFAVRLSRYARRVITQNVVISFGVKLVFLLLALTGFGSMWAAVLADSGTALAVTLNGMKPARYE